MSQQQNRADVLLDRNLAMIGRRLRLPNDPTNRQKQRWKRPLRSTGKGRFLRSIFFLKRHKTLTLTTGGLVAASVAVFFWLGLSGDGQVSAAMIFEGFKRSLNRSVWIKVEGVDMQNVKLDGQIYLRRGDDPNSQNDETIYSEMHVLLKSNNRKYFNDLDCAVVRCQNNGKHWCYNSVGGGIVTATIPFGKGAKVYGDGQLYLSGRSAKNKTTQDGYFGDIPLKHEMECWLGPFSGSKFTYVRYLFPCEQRDFLNRLLQMLLSFSDGQTADRIVNHLKKDAKNVRINKSNPADWQLIAEGFKSHLLGEPPDQKSAKAPEQWPKVDFFYSFQDDLHQTSGHYFKPSHPLSRAQRFALDRWLGNFNLYSFRKMSNKQIIAAIQPWAKKVTVKKKRIGWFSHHWDVHATGLKVGLKIRVTAADRSRAARQLHLETYWGALPAALEHLVLTIHYDPTSRSVDRAEFTNIVSGKGKIILQMNDRRIDPNMLTPEKWKKQPHTQVYP